jgi:ornithine cyclodeaminase/alanine dehydrogenase-like protein (mu-crystallin family)
MVSSGGKLLYLSNADVEKVGLEMRVVIELLERAFIEKAGGRVEMPHKFGIHPYPESFSHAMPAFIPSLKAAGLKWVSAYPGNLGRSLPNVSGLIVLNEVETGQPYAVMDASWITAARTGAATALSAKYLARPDSRTVGILACGVQGRSNLLALAELFPISQAYAYDIDPAAQARYIDEMRLYLGIDVQSAASPRQAVQGCDLVVTSGPILKDPAPEIQPDWLEPGAFASSVDFGSYWTRPSLQQMDHISTDDLEQYRAYRRAGYFAHVPDPTTDLSMLVSAGHPVRRQSTERAFAIHLGLALGDMAVAVEVYARAKEMGLGTWLER